MRNSKLSVCYCLHDDHWFLDASIRSFSPAGEIVAFVSETAWDGSAGDISKTVEICMNRGVRIVQGVWSSEDEQRRAINDFALAEDRSYLLIPDGDEVIEATLLGNLVRIAEADLAERVYVHWDTYWKSAAYVIRPRERFTPLELIKPAAVEHRHLRLYEGGRALLLGPEYGLVHHLSYAGPDARIERKIATWGHRNEIVHGWYQGVWKGWDDDKLMRNLHPTHPEAYGFAERIHPLVEIASTLNDVGEQGSTNGELQEHQTPSVDVVIPVHGGEDDLRKCLESLTKCKDLLTRVIVVDNASPDCAAAIAREYQFVKVVSLDSNRGYAAACNIGLGESSAEAVLFLNSDTVVPRIGLVKLLETLWSSGSIGAAGPLTNESGYDQRIEPTYTTLDTLDLFAQDFANRECDDFDAPNDMLVGFALAIRRSVIDEVGPFDESFGIGTFEDNDLCYRVRRRGFRLVVAAHSFIHHKGSATLRKVVSDPRQLLEKNRALFEGKWKDDILSGYASHLPGLKMGKVEFKSDLSPERRLARIKQNARRADISLCMIVRNEERVLAECLRSARPFFTQIVIVDTGSTDRTIEIARQVGAEVYEMVWPDSFSEARNESLKYARGRWVFWMDADDTIPLHCGEELLHCALNAPPDIAAFVVPVQFVEEGPGGGTRVDHVKLFRNGIGIKFEGRIHEQNLASINETGKKVARSAAYVLHSGYDTSEDGQARKRVRDEKLLKLDLDERPNHPFVLFNLGMTAHYTKDHEAAIRWLERSINVAQPTESHVRKAYALLGVSKRETGLNGEALSTFLKGLEVVGNDPELHFQAGLTLTEMERYQEAREHYEAIDSEIEDHFSSVDVSIMGFKRFHNLAAVCSNLNDYSAAKEWWMKALCDSPKFLPSAYALFDTALDKQDFATAKPMIDHIYAITGPSEDWAQMLVKLGEASGGPANADILLTTAVDRFPDAVGPRLVLSRRLLTTKREREAIAHLRHLSDLGSSEAAFFLGVGATRSGDFASALSWMERALELNPDHEQTREQVERLRIALR